MKQYEIASPRLGLTLRAAGSLDAVALTDRVNGRILACRGPELAVQIDAAERRLWITGWRGSSSPDAAAGLRAGWTCSEFNDESWRGVLNPALLPADDDTLTFWARTHVFVPADCAGRQLTLVLGGIGLFDFRFLRVFLNGRPLATRRYRSLWHEPLRVQLQRGVRFGQDNVLVLQLARPVQRTAKLDALDPRRTRTLPYAFIVPPQFEQHIVVGKECRSESFCVVKVKTAPGGFPAGGRRATAPTVIALKSSTLQATVRYQFAPGGAVLVKQVTLTNLTRQPVRVLRVSLGRYATGARASDGDQGFPVYLAGEFFLSLAHPAGWAMGGGRGVELRQYPGVMLAPGATWRSMEAVYGVGGRAGFRQYVQSRMRRTRRGHDRAYATYESFGSWKLPHGQFLSAECTETIVLRQIKNLARAQRVMRDRFDIFNVDFWVDGRGDIRRAAPERFPHQFQTVRRALAKQGVALGLWLDSSTGAWSIGGNPVVASCATGSVPWRGPLTTFGECFCRAAEPIRSLFADGFRYHLKENSARQFKFDNFQAICYNPHHEHLPGLYSTEPIMNSVIEFLEQLDRVCPAVFLMLYWGYRSPWWLLHGDTLFEPGLCVEAAHPAATPTPYARDGVTLGLDQAQWFCEDVPPLGKDSLGIWLSDWGWNSMVGKERWPEGFVMDICRGSLLAQPWGDLDQLTDAELRQMGTFLKLLRARPRCFSNPRFIGGNPWHNEPYGYLCRDGRRAFVALHNCTWRDARLPVPLDPGDQLFRWYPQPARLTGDVSQIALRPFAVVLLEIVPPGARPTLARRFASTPAPTGFAEPSRTFPLRVARQGNRWRVSGELPASARGGLLVLSAERARGGTTFQTRTPGQDFAARIRLAGRKVRSEPVLETQTYPAAWQAWRVRVRPASRAQSFRGEITVKVPAGVTVKCAAQWVPGD